MDINKDKYNFNDFVEIVRELRGEHGCPWDKAQTHESIEKDMVEESYEFVNEVDEKNYEGMCEELGDIMLNILLHAQMASEEKKFDIEDVVDGISKKMIYRHPHVFETDKVASVEEALDSFEVRKAKEKKIGGIEDKLKRIPNSYPMLLKSYKLSGILSKNLDGWDNEFDEKLIKNSIEKIIMVNNTEESERIIGDILFEICKLSKELNINPELALEKKYLKVYKDALK